MRDITKTRDSIKIVNDLLSKEFTCGGYSFKLDFSDLYGTTKWRGTPYSEWQVDVVEYQCPICGKKHEVPGVKESDLFDYEAQGLGISLTTYLLKKAEGEYEHHHNVYLKELERYKNKSFLVRLFTKKPVLRETLDDYVEAIMEKHNIPYKVME